MKASRVVVFFVLPLILGAASAAQLNSYLGQGKNEIKALSAEEIQGYLTGKGAGLAKAAELNHYPGPAHVLELADQLQLSDEQRQRTRAIFHAMQTEAVQQGKILIERERELDQQFATGEISVDRLHATLRRIGESHAHVRGAHLKAHIEQRAILTPAQIALYDRLRGYMSGDVPGSHGGHSQAH